ncbi:hypothetical protein RND81_06G122900 [Saponaria officinalis]|uniref:Uncharacterized protein n=1 Tax=Saponaria officinalis TaxID=3572 RepID=A0AAW1KAG0_SAPOF
MTLIHLHHSIQKIIEKGRLTLSVQPLLYTTNKNVPFVLSNETTMNLLFLLFIVNCDTFNEFFSFYFFNNILKFSNYFHHLLYFTIKIRLYGLSLCILYN